jgi:SAM-dependent methyltransferase
MHVARLGKRARTAGKKTTVKWGWARTWARARRRRTQAAVARWKDLWFYSFPGEARQCPACQTDDPVLTFPLPLSGQPDGRRVGFACGCGRCGLLFATPMPSRHELDRFYSASGEWGLLRQDEPEPSPPASAAYLQELLRPVEATFDVTRPRAGGRVLDIGCGNGELLDAFRLLGWSTFGIDPAVSTAFPRHRELASVPADESFDVVVLHHVIEHVAAPLAMLRSACAALRTGGVVVISVPRLDTLPAHRDLRYCLNARTHLMSYTRESLATLLTMAGFAPHDVSPPPDAAVRRRRVLRRLQMVGVKAQHPPTPPPQPLAAARRALNGFFAEQRPWWWRLLPVRTQAGLLNRARRGAK